MNAPLMSDAQTPPPVSPEVAELLSQLNDIVQPPTIGLWPLALGWWWLLILIFVLGFVTIATIIDLRRRKRYRRQALELLDALAPESNSHFATEVSCLLKRVALSAYPKKRKEIAPCYGSAWVTWLNRKSPRSIFHDDSAKALSEAPYRNDITYDAHQLKSAAKSWIQKHV